jgi:predicted esterase
VNEHRLTTVRRARYYSLGHADTATEFWIALHGYGQLAAEFLAPFAGLVRPGRCAVAPEALNRYYKDGGMPGSHVQTPIGTTWMTREDRDNEIADYVDFLDGVARDLGVAGRRLTVLGFSQGVATAVRWITRGDTTAARLILWAGAFPPDADLPRFRERTPQPLELVAGTRDEFAGRIDVDAQRQMLEEAGIASHLTTFDGGHRLDRKTLIALAGA